MTRIALKFLAKVSLTEQLMFFQNSIATHGTTSLNCRSQPRILSLAVQTLCRLSLLPLIMQVALLLLSLAQTMIFCIA